MRHTDFIPLKPPEQGGFNGFYLIMDLQPEHFLQELPPLTLTKRMSSICPKPYSPLDSHKKAQGPLFRPLRSLVITYATRLIHNPRLG